MRNIDEKVVKDFGTEWTKFDQTRLPEKESLKEFNRYFNIFPLNELNNKKISEQEEQIQVLEQMVEKQKMNQGSRLEKQLKG